MTQQPHCCCVILLFKKTTTKGELMARNPSVLLSVDTETRPISDWSAIYGIKKSAIRNRLTNSNTGKVPLDEEQIIFGKDKQHPKRAGLVQNPLEVQLSALVTELSQHLGRWIKPRFDSVIDNLELRKPVVQQTSPPLLGNDYFILELGGTIEELLLDMPVQDLMAIALSCAKDETQLIPLGITPDNNKNLTVSEFRQLVSLC